MSLTINSLKCRFCKENLEYKPFPSFLFVLFGIIYAILIYFSITISNEYFHDNRILYNLSNLLTMILTWPIFIVLYCRKKSFLEIKKSTK